MNIIHDYCKLKNKRRIFKFGLEDKSRDNWKKNF